LQDLHLLSEVIDVVLHQSEVFVVDFGVEYGEQLTYFGHDFTHFPLVPDLEYWFVLGRSDLNIFGDGHFGFSLCLCYDLTGATEPLEVLHLLVQYSLPVVNVHLYFIQFFVV